MAVERIGLSTYGLMWSLGDGAFPFEPDAPDLTLHDFVDRAIDWGVDTVQFADNRPLDSLPAAERRRLIDRVHEAGMSIEIAVRGADPEHLRAQLRLAIEADSSLLRTVLGTPGVRPISADDAIAAIAPLRREFEAAGVMLALENYDHLPVAELARVVDTLGEWTGVCLDTVNSFGALEGPSIVIDTLSPRTVNLHVKDFEVVRAPHTMGFSIEGRPAGTGRLSVPDLFARLRDRPPLTAVLELWTPPQEDLAATRRLEQSWAGESLSYLRSLVA
jgi:sugar phosphate isomerase/epimerase